MSRPPKNAIIFDIGPDNVVFWALRDFSDFSLHFPDLDEYPLWLRTRMFDGWEANYERYVQDYLDNERDNGATDREEALMDEGRLPR